MDLHGGSIENVILGGDFNFYDSSTAVEPAYNTILNGGNVLLFDPIATPGVWHNNSSFSNIHTQSTRSGTIGDGGSFGGMDDRFDFIFTTNDVLTGANGLTYIPNSYEAVGNDGNHFNQSLNSGTNNAAPNNVIDALYYMSDHLPVVLKVSIPVNVRVEELAHKNNWKGYFSDQHFSFKSDKTEQELTVLVYDVLGKTIQTKKFYNTKTLKLKLNQLKRGVYFVKVVSNTKQEGFKVFKQ